MGAIHRAPTVHNKDKVGTPQYRLDKENHREKYSKKQSNSRKKQSCGSSNPANMDVFFEPFLLQFLLSKRYWGAPRTPAGRLRPLHPSYERMSSSHTRKLDFSQKCVYASLRETYEVATLQR